MSPIHLSSKHNSVVKLMRAVAVQSHRAPSDLLLAEGIRALEEVSKAGCYVEAALISDSFGNESREAKLLEAWADTNVDLYRVPNRLLDSISAVRANQGAIALIRVPVLQLEDVAVSRRPLILCACDIQDPGNLGTLIRSAAAAGADMVCTTPGTVSARNTKSVRASAGAIFHIAVVEQVTPARFLEYCESRQIRAYRAAAHAGDSHFEVDLRGAVALVLGNEARGSRDQDWPGVSLVHIAMAARVESINVAAAGAVLLFEAFRQRAAARPNSDK